MIDPEELLDEWENGEETGLRPQRIQTVRDEIREYTGMPVPRRIVEIESWLDRMQGQITRKLRERVEDESGGDGESDGSVEDE